MSDIAAPYRVDKKQVKAAFNLAADTYDAVAVLQHEVGRRMLERLEFIRIDPRWIVDIGSGTGRNSRALINRYKSSKLLAVDLAQSMLRQARHQTGRWQRWRRRQHWVCGDAENLPLRARCADLLFSSLTLQWCSNLEQTFGEFHRVLQPGGLLMFSSFGPDTLRELRHSWQVVDQYNHVNAFIDMHDIGDALLRAGFADPVMDVEHITLTYPDIRQLMRELKAIGAHNVTAGRPRGLTGRRKLQALASAYEAYRRDGKLPCTYEVVYGHAWVPLHQDTRQARDGEVRIPLSSLRSGGGSRDQEPRR
jgi:malonyl-CoA O-methyltransferase